MRKFLLTLSLAIGCYSLIAGGFQVSLNGHKQSGMGIVGTSIVHDASIAFFNPAGLSFMKQKYSFSGGVSFLKSMVAFQKNAPSVYQAETDSPWGTPLTIYLGAKIKDRIGVGLAVNTPFGNGLKWEEKWAGRYLIEDIQLKAFFIQPTVSYKITPYLSLGAGFVYATGDFDLNKALPIENSQEEGQVNIKGKADNIGYNLGLLVMPTKKLAIGLDYRSSVEMAVKDGDADFTVPASLQANFPAGNKVDVTLNLPANFDIGASYQLDEKWLFGVNACFVFWGIYDSLNFDFKTNTASLQDSKNPREYEDVIIYRVGGQYKMNDKLSFRLGAYYDPTPVNKKYFSPETPSLNVTALTCGIGWSPVNHLSIDASFLYLNGKEMDMNYDPDNFGGTYKSVTYVTGLSISYSL